MDIPTEKGWAIFADCEIIYNGRAASTLQRGNYLIIYKPDASVAIHGSTLVTPRNYLSSGTHCTIADNIITFSRGRELITITINRIHSRVIFEDWSGHKVNICRTERELALKIFNNWHDYFVDDFEIIELEYQTDLGPIDILGFTATTEYLVEVKRRIASIKDVTQLLRYIEARSNTKSKVRGFLAAPSISRKALKYLMKRDLGFLQVDF